MSEGERQGDVFYAIAGGQKKTEAQTKRDLHYGLLYDERRQKQELEAPPSVPGEKVYSVGGVTVTASEAAAAAARNNSLPEEPPKGLYVGGPAEALRAGRTEPWLTASIVKIHADGSADLDFGPSQGGVVRRVRPEKFREDPVAAVALRAKKKLEPPRDRFEREALERAAFEQKFGINFDAAVDSMIASEKRMKEVQEQPPPPEPEGPYEGRLFCPPLEGHDAAARLWHPELFPDEETEAEGGDGVGARGDEHARRKKKTKKKKTQKKTPHRGTGGGQAPGPAEPSAAILLDLPSAEEAGEEAIEATSVEVARHSVAFLLAKVRDQTTALVVSRAVEALRAAQHQPGGGEEGSDPEGGEGRGGPPADNWGAMGKGNGGQVDVARRPSDGLVSSFQGQDFETLEARARREARQAALEAVLEEAQSRPKTPAKPAAAMPAAAKASEVGAEVPVLVNGAPLALVPPPSGLAALDWSPLAPGLCRLSLRGNGLAGRVPDSLAALRQLKTLDLASNAFTGPVPAWIGNPAYAAAALAKSRPGTAAGSGGPASKAGSDSMASSGTQGSGTGSAPGGGSGPGEATTTSPGPALWAPLRRLVEVDLSANRLSGTLAAVAGASRLKHLDLGGNKLSGALDALLPLPRLETLRLRGNKLSGPGLDQLVEDKAAIARAAQAKALAAAQAAAEAEAKASGKRIRGQRAEEDAFEGKDEVDGVVVVRLPRLSELDVRDNNLDGPLPRHLTRLAQEAKLLSLQATQAAARSRAQGAGVQPGAPRPAGFLGQGLGGVGGPMLGLYPLALKLFPGNPGLAQAAGLVPMPPLPWSYTPSYTPGSAAAAAANANAPPAAPAPDAGSGGGGGASAASPTLPLWAPLGFRLPTNVTGPRIRCEYPMHLLRRDVVLDLARRLDATAGSASQLHALAGRHPTPAEEADVHGGDIGGGGGVSGVGARKAAPLPTHEEASDAALLSVAWPEPFDPSFGRWRER
eukprot:CAMPEP_0172597916 /NCGR_PEP_ID=MMETSP1068-20121228/17899_1 /TAXON_ID=35684 /ORGANISM="Pseudopedinella elastica, Strain CCMP716" /LENGTH=978 /DNA_ID=CAMNT_0013397577 /DNA_START=252 /DNA_END=3185 /DNA_ORIENTATION=-